MRTLVSMARTRRRLPTVHEIEQLVAVEDIDPRLLRALPARQVQRELLPRRGAAGQSLPEKIVRHGLDGSPFGGRPPLDLPQDRRVDHQRGSWHASKCIEW